MYNRKEIYVKFIYSIESFGGVKMGETSKKNVAIIVVVIGTLTAIISGNIGKKIQKNELTELVRTKFEITDVNQSLTKCF